MEVCGSACETVLPTVSKKFDHLRNISDTGMASVSHQTGHPVVHRTFAVDSDTVWVDELRPAFCMVCRTDS